MSAVPPKGNNSSTTSNAKSEVNQTQSSNSDPKRFIHPKFNQPVQFTQSPQGTKPERVIRTAPTAQKGQSIIQNNPAPPQRLFLDPKTRQLIQTPQISKPKQTIQVNQVMGNPSVTLPTTIQGDVQSSPTAAHLASVVVPVIAPPSPNIASNSQMNYFNIEAGPSSRFAATANSAFR